MTMSLLQKIDGQEGKPKDGTLGKHWTWNTELAKSWFQPVILKSQNEQIALDIDILGRFFCHSFCSFLLLLLVYIIV